MPRQTRAPGIGAVGEKRPVVVGDFGGRATRVKRGSNGPGSDTWLGHPATNTRLGHDSRIVTEVAVRLGEIIY